MMTTAENTAPAPAIPDWLVREELDGRPLYYKGYRDVLAGQAVVEEIMGSSDLQSVLVGVLYGSLWGLIDRKRYQMVTSEAGLHISRGNNFAADIAIFDKETLPALKGNYFEVPPKVIIEVDIRIDWSGPEDGINYILEKSQTLFNFGVERILWVLTAPRKVVILQPGRDTVITDWSNDIPVLDNCSLNIKKLLDEEEITF